MRQIYIEKLAEVKGGLPARNMDEHIMGKPNDNYSSIPIEYNLEGYLLYEIEVGNNVFIDRTKRNGVEVRGVFWVVCLLGRHGCTSQLECYD